MAHRRRDLASSRGLGWSDVSLTVVYCPDCGASFYYRNGVAASTAWAEHFRVTHSTVRSHEEER